MSCASRFWFVVLFCTLPRGIFAQTGPAPNGMKERDHLRNVRYCEVFVVRKHFFSATADVYNTLGLNDCPAEKWASLDTAKLKNEWNVAAIVLNGPRYFIMDRNAIQNPGKVESFDGLDARLLAELEVRIHSDKRQPYTENGVKRQNRYVYERGKNVYELLSRWQGLRDAKLFARSGQAIE